MPCYHPLDTQLFIDGTGKQRARIFKKGKHDGNKNAELPCGRCLGCRLEKAKEWALRCWHESQMHDYNSFVTLTYSPQHLPANQSLDHSHVQKFLKKLRFRTGANIRYFMCGEYGENTARPHYHLILFGYDFPDKKLVNIRNGNRVYTSEILKKTWGLGDTEIGSVTFKSAGYVARYILKKQKELDKESGELPYHGRKPPYTAMSLKPAIGKSYYEQFQSDFFPHDFAVMPDGRQTAVPRYYRKLLRDSDPDLFEELRKIRVEKSQNDPNNTPDRIAVREQCRLKKTQRLQRNYL